MQISNSNIACSKWIAVALIWAVLMLDASSLLAQELPEMAFVDNPAPVAADLSPPGPEVPDDIADWYGLWHGRWDGKWPMVIAVAGFEKHSDEWRAQVHYYWQEGPGEGFRTRLGLDGSVPITARELRMTRITVLRDLANRSAACVYGDFPTPRTAHLHFSEFGVPLQWVATDVGHPCTKT